MTEYAYSPMVKPREVSQERLNEIMARRGGKKVEGGSGEPLGATGRAEQSQDLAQPKPSPTSAALQWQERVKGTNYQHDTTGRYTVSASRVEGTYVFSAYFGRNPGSVLGVAQKSAQAARQIAEAHARGER